MAKAEERTPYIVVAFQECERMNMLTSEIKRSLKELNLGLKVTKVYIYIHSLKKHSLTHLGVLFPRGGEGIT